MQQTADGARAEEHMDGGLLKCAGILEFLLYLAAVALGIAAAVFAKIVDLSAGQDSIGVRLIDHGAEVFSAELVVVLNGSRHDGFVLVLVLTGAVLAYVVSRFMRRTE